jgi:hypothetical protein
MAAVEKGMCAVLAPVIVGDCLIKVYPCRCPITYESIGRSQRVMRLKEERRVLRALGQAEQLLSLVQSRPDFPARDMKEEEPPQRREEIRRFSQLTAQDVRTRVDRLNVGRRPVPGGKKGRAQGDLQGEFFAGALEGVRQ